MKKEGGGREETIRKIAPVIAVLVLAVIIFSLIIPRGADRCERILLSEARDDCYLTLAKEANNQSLCARIERPFMRDMCITGLGMQPATSADCERISDAALRGQCITSLVQSTGNYSYCQALPSPLERDICYSNFAGKNAQPMACEGVSVDYLRTICNNDAYQRLAVSRRNPSLCSQMSANDSATQLALADQCIYAVAKEANDTSLCAGIQGAALRGQCITGGSDFSACEQTSDYNQRLACFYSVALNSNDPNSCDRIPTPHLRDNCFYQFAAKNSDRSICSRISSDNLRSLCTGTG